MKTTILTIALALVTSWSIGQDTKNKKSNKMETQTLNEQQVKGLTMLAHGLSTPPRTPVLRKPGEAGLKYEEVKIKTQDGLELNAWFIPADSDKYIISNHFSPGNRYGFAGHMEGLDFAGGFEVNFIPRYKALHDAGYNVLTYDIRMHGESPEGKELGILSWGSACGSVGHDVVVGLVDFSLP